MSGNFGNLVLGFGGDFFSATGGTISTYTRGGVNYKVHTFTSSGTFAVSGSKSMTYLVVAGGGAGGEDIGGGGGAGGLLADSLTADQNYSIVIGAGGVSPSNTGGWVGKPGNGGSGIVVVRYKIQN